MPLKFLRMTLSLFFVVTLLIPLLPIRVEASELVCVKEHLSTLEEEGETTLGISETRVESLLWDIAIATDLPSDFMAGTVVLPCAYVEKAVAYFPNAFHVDLGVPARNYFIYDPDWTREVIGGDNWQAVALFGHELGHFWLSHFEQPGKSRIVKEEEADQFSGCIVAKLGGPWEAVEDLLSRIRRDTATSKYPDRLTSLEKARQGYDDCTDASDAGSTPTSTVSAEAISQLVALISRESSNGIDQEDAALLQTMLNSLGFDAGPVDGRIGRRSTRAMSSFQRQASLEETGRFDALSVASLADSYARLFVAEQMRRGAMPGSAMSEKARCVARINLPSGKRFFEAEFVQSGFIERAAFDGLIFPEHAVLSCRNAVLSEPDNPDLTYRYGLGLFSNGNYADFLEAWYWITNAAAQGHIDALYAAGLVYSAILDQGYDGDKVYFGEVEYDGDERSLLASQAKVYLRSPAEDGNPAAMVRLVGLKYEESGKFDDIMRQWLSDAASQGLPHAQYLLSRYHYFGENGFNKSRSAASYWESKALENGHPLANASEGFSNLYGWPAEGDGSGLESSITHRKERARDAARRFVTAIEGGYFRPIYMLENLTPETFLSASLFDEVADWENPCAKRGFDGQGISCLEYKSDPNAGIVIFELVSEIQSILRQLGLFSGRIDGRFGAGTKNALLQLCDCRSSNEIDPASRAGFRASDVSQSPIAQVCLRSSEDYLLARPFREIEEVKPEAVAVGLEACSIASRIYPENQQIMHSLGYAAQKYSELVGDDLPSEPFYLKRLLHREYSATTFARSVYGKLSEAGHAPSQYRYYQLARNLDGYSEIANSTLIDASNREFAPAQFELSRILMSDAGFANDKFGAVELAYMSVKGGYEDSIDHIRSFPPDLVELVRMFLRDDGYWQGAVSGEFDRRTELALFKACNCFDQ